jgi:hypothetical protein
VIPIPCPVASSPGPLEAEVIAGSASLFARVRRAIGIDRGGTPWFRCARLPGGSHYLRWSGLFEFLIAADGRRIACRSLDGATLEAFQTYLVSQVLSFALLQRGVESLHSTAVVIDGEAVGFVGDCGCGKSSLGAAFLQAGYPLLTDDLLVVRETRAGFVTYPGPPRIKLFPGVAKSLLGDQVAGTPMNNLTPKLVIPLGEEKIRVWQGVSPLKAIYVLKPPTDGARGSRVTIRRLSPRQAFIELLKNTFNPMVVEPARLERQFEVTARLASKVPVRSLSFPRTLDRLPAVCEAVRSDLVAS